MTFNGFITLQKSATCTQLQTHVERLVNSCQILEHYLGVFTLGLLHSPTRFLSKRTLVASFVRLYEATISKRRSARSNAASGELTSPLASSPNDPIHSLAHTLKSYAVSRPPIVNPRQLFSSVRNCMGLRNTFHRIVQKYFWGQKF